MTNKKKIKSLLVCNSNMFLPTVLTEVLTHPQEHYLVISDINNIVEFLTFLDIQNVELVKYGNIRGWLDSIKKKKQLLEQVSQYDIVQLVFFHAEFGGIVNWLIKRLSHTIPIRYCMIYDKMPLPPYKSFLKVLKIKLKEKILWDMKVDVLDRGRPILSLPDSFYSEINASVIKMQISLKLVSEYVSNKLSCYNIYSKYVLLTGTVVSVKLCSAKEYEHLINCVIDLLGKDNTVSKCHPRFRNLYGSEIELRQIPSFIPGNVLIDNYDCYIGFESTLLVEAAIAGKRSISLIDLLPLSDDVKQHWHDFFASRLQDKGCIFFPKSIDELRRVCI